METKTQCMSRPITNRLVLGRGQACRAEVRRQWARRQARWCAPGGVGGVSGHQVHSATAAHVLHLLRPHWRPADACTPPQWWSECTHEISRESLARRITKCRTTLGQRNERMIHPRARIEGADWLAQCTEGQHIETCMGMQEHTGQAQCAAHGWRVGMARSTRALDTRQVIQRQRKCSSPHATCMPSATRACVDAWKHAHIGDVGVQCSAVRV